MIAARAAVLLAEWADPQLTDVQIRPRVDDEVLVRIDTVAICHTERSSRSDRGPVRRAAKPVLVVPR